MQAEQQSERERFEAWAKEEGYDTANTYDTERSRWIWLNPMTADLWTCWRAALSHPSPQGWINVDEQLPEVVNLADGSVGSVMVLFANGREPEAGSRWMVANTVWAQKARLHGVTHWMTLPPPPEQGSKG